MQSSAGRPCLTVDGLSKRYGTVTVLHDVSLQIDGGKVHALVGANGAGKSTLCKVIAGLTMPSEGSMRWNDTPYRPTGKQAAEAAGVQIVQQELNLIGNLTVAENLFFSRLPQIGGVIRQRRLRGWAAEVLHRFGLPDVDPDAPLGSLGIGRQQMVEIAVSLAKDARLLILDEPTAALSPKEAEELFEHLKTFRRRGVGIIYISHRLDEVSELSDQVTILRDGKVVTTRDTASLSRDEMIAFISGEAKQSTASAHVNHSGRDVALHVDRLSANGVHDCTFEVHRGQRLGIFGLVGSGRTELLRAIFGADPIRSGEVRLGSAPAATRFRHPAAAVRAGLAMVTEDRKHNGLLLSQTIAANATLNTWWNQFSRWGLMKSGRIRQASTEKVTELDIRCEGIDQMVGTLSGGNQQKVAIAKWLIRDAEVFLFDEPTRGIDIAARRRIYRLIESLSSRGKACVVVSSDLDELMEICDSIAVISQGRMVDQFDRSAWNRDAIMTASFAGDRP